MNRRGYCIFIDTILQGAVPSVRESVPNTSDNHPDRICVFPTELEAQREIVDAMMIRLQEFLDGERDFDDAIIVEEYIVEVEVLADGKIVDANGNSFG
jgi:hypothetical protein